MDKLLIVLGVWLAGSALRTFQTVWLRKPGALLYLVASYLAGFYLGGGSHATGCATVAGWFLLPWVEILLRVRTMRLPISKTLSNRFPPSRDEFPHLRELTAEVEEAGFEMLEDTGWDGGEVRQFIRLFYMAEKRIQASISLNQQRGAGIVYISLTTRTADGRTFTTTDYPFSSTMPLAPGVQMNQTAWAGSIPALLTAHTEWLEKQGVTLPQDAAEVEVSSLSDRLSGELEQQIRHNLSRGILKDTGEGTFRYSWRGCFYLWRQFIKDMVRLA